MCALRNNLANILLLRKSELTQANDLAKKPTTPRPTIRFTFPRMPTLYCSGKKPNDALKVLDGMKPEYLK